MQVMGIDGTMTTQTQTTTTTTVTQFNYAWYANNGMNVNNLVAQDIKPGQTNLYNQLTNYELKNMTTSTAMFSNTALMGI